jgi:hypothetical protein
VRRGLVLLVVALSLAGGCKRARQWAEKRSAERKAEHERVEAIHAAEPAQVRALPDGPGLAPGRYRIIELRVEALPTDEGGNSWDPAGPGHEPDLKITGSAGDTRFSCRVPDDRLRGQCKLDVEIAVDAATRIDVDVVDRDAVVDDPVGGATLQDPARWGAGMALPLMPSGRLRSATLVFAATPTWWALYGTRVLGLGAGVVFALFTIGAFRRSFLPAPAPARPRPTCSHCNAILGAATVTCSNCGAVQKGSAS